MQLYLRDEYASLSRPVMELAGFCRVDLDAGQSTTVEFAVPVSLLAFLDTQLEWLVEAGDVEVMVGASSADIRLRDRIVVRRSTHIEDVVVASSPRLAPGRPEGTPPCIRAIRSPRARCGSMSPATASTPTAARLIHADGTFYWYGENKEHSLPGSGIWHWECAATPRRTSTTGPTRA